MIIRINGQKTRITITDTEGCTISLRDNITIHPFSGSLKKGDPLHVACMEHFRRHLRTYDMEHLLSIRGLPILISRDSNRYFINGICYPQTTITNALARVLVKSINEQLPNKLLSSLYLHLNRPENISYALENRIPYKFYHRSDDGIRNQDVRLNLKQIGKKDFAIEISDGLWGSIAQSDLNTFVNSGRFNHKRGKWHSLSPTSLFTKLVGRGPSNSELALMLAFLMQNRKRDIVEKRAMELLLGFAQKHKDRVSFIESEGGYTLFVKGEMCDWQLVSRGKTANEESTQGVNVYVWGVGRDDSLCWKGPICIDNMSAGSSMGDQLVGRALPLLNDSMTINRVNTISGYIEKEDNPRLSLEEMIEKSHLMGG